MKSISHREALSLVLPAAMVKCSIEEGRDLNVEEVREFSEEIADQMRQRRYDFFTPEVYSAFRTAGYVVDLPAKDKRRLGEKTVSNFIGDLNV